MRARTAALESQRASDYAKAMMDGHESRTSMRVECRP